MCTPTRLQRHTVHTASPVLGGECHICQKGQSWSKIRMPSSNSYHQTHPVYVCTYVHCHAYDTHVETSAIAPQGISTESNKPHERNMYVRTYMYAYMTTVCSTLYPHVWSTYGTLLASLCCVLWRRCTKYVICIFIDTNIGTDIHMYVHTHVQ